MIRANREYIFEGIPRILFQLFVTKGQLAVFEIDIKNRDVNFLTDFGIL